jgi:hypothetical protein
VHRIVEDERLGARLAPAGGDSADERDPLVRLIQTR